MAVREYDKSVSGASEGDLSVIDAINEFRNKSEEAKRDRLDKNRRNRDVFLGRQDFSHKLPGQSREFLPKVPNSVEQMCSFIKKSLVQSGDWFSVGVSRDLEDVIYGTQIAAIMRVFLDNLYKEGGGTQKISSLISDAVKIGLLESMMILKVHGGIVTKRSYFTEPGLATGATGKVSLSPSLGVDEVDEWRLRIDLIRPEDYYPDPTGNNLYEIHTVERDIHTILKQAEQGIYDERAVKQLIDIDYARPEDEKRTDYDRNQPQTGNPGFRKRCVLDEFWGTLLNKDGTVAQRNVVATVANKKFLIRPPEPNPFWHQESPFVAVPLIRVPFSVWHKALYDSASDLNMALNEFFNLILDGGLAAVWGVRQIRIDDMEDPSQVAGGIPQGATIAVKSTLPISGKVIEQVTEGEVPNDAMAVFEFLNREFTQAALTNELKLGSLPAKPVKATEVVEASQSQAVTLDGVISDVETDLIEEVLWKSWLTILQNADSIPEETLSNTLDAKSAMMILRAPPEERFALFAGKTKFKVTGLSGMLAKSRDFQKLLAIMQAVGVNPLLFQAFMQEFSAKRALRTMMRNLDINPDDLVKSPQEIQTAPADAAQLAGITQMLGGGASGTQGGRNEGATTGEPGLQSQASQMAAPATGLPPNA